MRKNIAVAFFVLQVTKISSSVVIKINPQLY